MTYHNASTDLVNLIQQVSALTAQRQTLQVFSDRAAAIVRHRLQAVRVNFTLRAGKSIISSEILAPNPHATAAFLFSRPITSRAENHGTLQVDLDRPTHPPELLMTALDTLTSLIGLHVARQQLAGENASLAATAEELRASLADSKTLVRATGIIAALHGWSLGAAQNWLQIEAAKSRRSVVELADLVVLQRQVTLDQPYRRTA